MTADHAHFDVMCALAASGQLTNSELAELHEHSEGCSSCCDRLVEMKHVSAELFCAHALSQPGFRMPKDIVERFIARANSEGVPLHLRATGVGLKQLVSTAAFVLALLLVSATLYFGTLWESADETARGNTASVSTSINDKTETSLEAPRNVASDNTRANRAASHQKASGIARGYTTLVSRASGHRRPSQDDSSGLEESQFDLAVYSRNLAMSHRPFNVATKLDQNIQWAPAQKGLPRFHFSEPLGFAKDEPPRLLAEYEHRTFAPWSSQDSLAFSPPYVQVLRRDFDPNAYRTLLKLDFKKNLPAFQFAPNDLQ